MALLYGQPALSPQAVFPTVPCAAEAIPRTSAVRGLTAVSKPLVSYSILVPRRGVRTTVPELPFSGLNFHPVLCLETTFQRLKIKASPCFQGPCPRQPEGAREWCSGLREQG